MSLLAMLAGLGQAAKGLPEGMIAGDKIRQQQELLAQGDARMAEQTRQFDVGQEAAERRHQESLDESRRKETTDLTPLINMGIVPREASPTMQTNLVGPLMTYLGREQKDEPKLVGDNVRGTYTKAGGFQPFPEAPAPPFTPPAGFVPASVTVGHRGKETTTYKPPEKAEGSSAQERVIDSYLTQHGYEPGTPRYADARLKLFKQVQVPEGAQIFNPQALLGSQTPGQPSPPTPAIEGRPKPPEVGERKDLSESKSAIELGQKVLSQWDALWPSYRQRLGFRELPGGIRMSNVIGGQMTPEQSQLYADASHVIGEIRRALSGLAVTDPEARRMVAALPNDPSLLTKEQLASAVGLLERRRGNLQQTLVESNRRPGPALAPAPVQPTIWILRDKSGRERRYQPEPGETTPPAGYQRVR